MKAENLRCVHASEQFIKSNTKPCPRCGVPIEKNGNYLFIFLSSSLPLFLSSSSFSLPLLLFILSSSSSSSSLHPLPIFSLPSSSVPLILHVICNSEPQQPTCLPSPGGCMRMTCSMPNCKHDWCWICGIPWNRQCQSTHWFG